MGLQTPVQNRKLVWKCSFKVCHPNFFFFLIIYILNEFREMGADYVTCSLYEGLFCGSVSTHQKDIFLPHVWFSGWTLGLSDSWSPDDER